MGEIWGSFVGFMEQALLWCATLTGSAGLGIILFTACTRLLLLPLTLSSIRSSRKMQELQPMIKELQRKHGKDQRKLQEETVKLYQEYKINPVGGCLPMFLQLPIFIGVYWAVLHLMSPGYYAQLDPSIQAVIHDPTIQKLFTWLTIGSASDFQSQLSPAVQEAVRDPAIKEILAAPFFGIDLGTKPFEEGFKNFQGVEYLVLPVLSIVLQFTQQIMAMPRVQDPQQKAMTRAMMFMPLFFAYITLIFPAGAVLYWVTSSAIGIAQQYFTSGWGSLANYLKFLPPDGKSKQATPALATSAASGAVNAGTVQAEGSSSSAGAAAATMPSRPNFWDIMQPLVEADIEPSADSHATSGRSERTERTERTERSGRQKQKKSTPHRSRRRS